MKVISIEEVNVLVKLKLDCRKEDDKGYTLGEADRKVRILTDDDCVVTRYLIDGDERMERWSLDRVVENEDDVCLIDKGYDIDCYDIRDWIETQRDVYDYDDFEPSCNIVSLLAKHGLWKDEYHQYVKDALMVEKCDYSEKEQAVAEKVTEILDNDDFGGECSLENVKVDDYIHLFVRGGIDISVIAAIGKAFADKNPRLYSIIGNETEIVITPKKS